MWWFGRPPRAQPGSPEADDMWTPLAKTLQESDPDQKFQWSTIVRAAAANAKTAQKATSRLERIRVQRPRRVRGPFLPGERVLVYRRGLRMTKERGKTKGSHGGSWYGPGLILANESWSGRVRPRVLLRGSHGTTLSVC